MLPIWSAVALADQTSLQYVNSARTSGFVPGTNWNVGYWMWDAKTLDGQECHFWRTVEIPASSVVRSAKLRIGADNFFSLFVDGQEIGSGADWRTLIEYDLAELLTPGTHVLAIKGVNDFDVAGVLMGLRIELADGQSIEVLSDAGWRVVPAEESNWTVPQQASPRWPAATLVGGIKTFPWNERGDRVVFKAPRSHRLIIPFWQQRWFFIAELVFCGLATVVCLYLLMRLLMQSQAQLVVQRERSRIARDIHDDLTAWLARLVLLGERTQSELPEKSSARVQVEEMCENSRSLMTALNQTVWVINSKRDTLRDLVSYVCRYAESFFQATPIRCRFDVEDDMPALSCDVGVRRNLFLAVKESLNNVLKHSAANEVTLRIHWQAGELVILVEDNGKGFAPEQANAQRNGLSNMKDRAADAGGYCRIHSKPGAGCRIEFCVPLNSSRRRSLWSWITAKNSRAKSLANPPLPLSPSAATTHENEPQAQSVSPAPPDRLGRGPTRSVSALEGVDRVV